jgi:hypothetical protein
MLDAIVHVERVWFFSDYWIASQDLGIPAIVGYEGP